MKKIIIGILSVLIIGATAFALINVFGTKTNNGNEISETESNNLENQEEVEQKEGYEIIVSKKDIKIEKGKNTTFEITFTIPDISSVREYIVCEDQSDIILVRYSDVIDRKITVEVEALKVGTTKIEICDFNYQDVKEVVNVNVIEPGTTESGVTAEMAYEGVYNYCHSEYDWSISEDNPSIMYIKMGEETENEYQVIFRSYTGSFVYFYVNKADGTTRLIDYVPALNIKSEAGTINIYDYLNK